MRLLILIFHLFLFHGLFCQAPTMKNPERKAGKCYISNSVGNVLASGRCKNQQMIGVWKYYTTEGKLEKTVRYNKGKAGVTYIYNETGNKTISKITKKGKQVKLRKCNC